MNATTLLLLCEGATTADECNGLGSCCIWNYGASCPTCRPRDQFYGVLFYQNIHTDNDGVRCNDGWHADPLLIGVLVHVLCFAPLLFGLVFCSWRVRRTKAVPRFKASMLDPRRELTNESDDDEGGEVDLVAVQADPPELLLGVSVRRVLLSLAGGETPAAVKTALFEGSKYLRHIPPSAKLGIISYRVCGAKVGADGVKEDEFTLDEEAFLSALAAAQANGVDYLWLDCWAYRKQPPWGAYVHRDFCATLAMVMWRTNHVIWLPRSRSHAAGQYQYRVWCTFEAAIVGFRSDVGVSIAGHPPSVQQARLHLLGSYVCASPLPPCACACL